MVQLECLRPMQPLVLFTFGDHCRVPFPPNAEKREMLHVASSMWLVNKVEI